MKLIHGDCIEKMKDIESNSIDMVMTSPPYDNLRDYGKDFTGWGEHIWKPVLEGIFRVLKDGGVCVWVVGDATIKGSETGTSFKQALYWMEIGGKLHDTMIYEKNAVGACGSKNCYNQAFEYMFIFVKNKIAVFNPIKDLVPNNAGGITRYTKNSKSNKNGYSSETIKKETPLSSKRKNIWKYNIGFSSGYDSCGHPAVFPLKLAKEHIISWSNENDIILDPFMGSGTTGLACIDLKRDFIGIELDENYFNISVDRINKAKEKKELSFFVVD